MIGSLDMRERAAVLGVPVSLMVVFLFLISKQILNITTFEMYSELKNCTVNNIENVSSTKKDAIFTSAFSYNHRLELLIRSIKSTGCRATIYIFTPNDVHIPLSILSKNVKQIKASPLTTRNQKSPEKVRWEWYLNFITSKGIALDRVIHTDSSNSFFFSDPFSVVSSNESLYFLIEQEKQIQSDKAYFNALTKCHYQISNKTLYKHPINSAFLGGSKVSFTYFVEMMITHNEWPLCWNRDGDRGDFNYVLWENEKIIPFSLKFLNCSSGFISANNKLCIDKFNDFNEESKSDLKKQSSIIYLTDYLQSPSISNDINNRCPPNENVRYA